MQRDLHLIYKQIPVIWIKAGKPTSDTQKVGKKEQLKILRGHNSAHSAKQNFIIPEWNSVDIMPPAVRKEMAGNTRKWESVYPKKIKEIIWRWGKRRGHTVLSPFTSWLLLIPENQATAVAAESREEMALNHSDWSTPPKTSAFLKSYFLTNFSTNNSVPLKGTKCWDSSAEGRPRLRTPSASLRWQRRPTWAELR